MNKTAVFNNLVGNGFDFLKKSLQEFEKEPKFSVIHFYSALELFLKARLLREHWTLILTKPEQGDLTKFQAGNFHSINLDDADKRLRDILQDGLTADEIRCFRDLRDHRNRMVHFFHAGATAKKDEIETIVSQQCRGWYYLHGLLSHRWKAVFAKHQSEVLACDKAMRKYRQFLKTRFADLGDQIKQMRTAGVKFHKCPSCGFKAFKEDDTNDPALEFDCLVCSFSRGGVSVECPSCSKRQTLIGEAWQACSSCGHKISDEEIKADLSDWIVVTKDNMYDAHEASCGECQGHMTVVPLQNGKWVCSACFTSFDESDIGTCGWCGEHTTEDVEDSYWAGCEYCDGQAGWHADKDD